MANSKSICRLCLKLLTFNEFSSLDSNCLEKLALIAPDLKLVPTINPVICNTCAKCLEEFHKLKRLCSSSNKLISFLKNCLGVDHSMELKELMKVNKTANQNCTLHEHICRVCLKNRECNYISISDVKVLSSCLSDLDESLTINPVVCKVCVEALHNTCAFIEQLTTTENKVKSHCEKTSSNNIDLFEVLKSKEQDDISEKQEKNNKLSDLMGREHQKRPIYDKSSETALKKRKAEQGPSEIDLLKLSATPESLGRGLGMEEFPPFSFRVDSLLNLQKKRILIEDWLKQIEKLKCKYNWPDSVVKYRILEMMKETPILFTWFSKMVIEISWEEWKEKLISMFPEKDDYFINLLMVITKRKKPEETFVDYFNDKVSLLKSMDISQEHAVSCLLGGLTNHGIGYIGRMGRYKSPEELLTFLKVCDADKIKDENMNSGQYSGNDGTVGNKNTCNSNEFVKADEVSKVSSNVKCSCCDQRGHLSIDCPFIKTSKISSTNNMVPQNISLTVGLSKPKIEEINTEREISPKIAAGQEELGKSQQPNKKCLCCDMIGHSSTDCPMVRGLKPEVLQTSVNADTEERRQNESTQSCDSVGNGDQNQNINGGNKTQNCDNSERSSLPPPLTEHQQNCQRSTSISTIVPVPDKDRLGKDSKRNEDDSVCKEVQPKQVSPPNNGTKTNKCSCCNSVGHTSINCPLLALSTNAGKKNTQKVETISPSCIGSDKSKNQNVISKEQPPTEKNFAPIQKRFKPSRQCLCCNEFGHGSLDCPLLQLDQCNPTDRAPNPKSSSSNQQNSQPAHKGKLWEASEKSVLSKNVLVCAICGKWGHQQSECFYANVGERIGEVQPPRQCLLCGKFGHLKHICPKNKAAAAAAATRKRL